MLGLATHESRFYVLREEVLSVKHQTARCSLCGSEGHTWAFIPSLPQSGAMYREARPSPRGTHAGEPVHAPATADPADPSAA